MRSNSFTSDVYAYLTRPGVRDAIDVGVRAAFDTEPTVVVSHSLGTVVAYNLLRRDGSASGWRVSTLITLGCPLSVGPLAQALKPIQFPECVGDWRRHGTPFVSFKDDLLKHLLSLPLGSASFGTDLTKDSGVGGYHRRLIDRSSAGASSLSAWPTTGQRKAYVAKE